MLALGWLNELGCRGSAAFASLSHNRSESAARANRHSGRWTGVAFMFKSPGMFEAHVFTSVRSKK
jgi:hypothetical protein